MAHAYIITQGSYGDFFGSFEFLCGKKKTAETILKREGFRKDGDIWIDGEYWRRVERIEYRGKNDTGEEE